MRVLYLCADPGIDLAGQGGGSIHIRALVHALRGLGHEVTVVCHAVTNGSPGIANVSRDLRLARWNHALGSTIRSVNRLIGRTGRHHPDIVRGLHNLTAFRFAARVIRELRPDFIYERYSLWGTTGLWLSRKYSIPLVLEVNAPLVYEQKRYRGLTFPSLAAKTERMIWRGADLIVAVSESLRHHFQQARVRPERIHILPNAVDTNLFRTDVDGELVKKRFRLDGRFVVGFVGTFKQWHGVDFLFEAFRRLHQGDPDMHLLLVGEGPLRKSLEQMIGQMGLNGAVTFAGRVAHEDVPFYLTAMDVAVAPYPDLSEFYYSPLKVFEYMAAGRAIVASGMGQLTQVLANGETGLLFKPGDAEDLIRCIQRLRGDSEMRRELGKRASVASRSYTWSENALKVIEWAAPLVSQGPQQFFRGEEKGVV